MATGCWLPAVCSKVSAILELTGFAAHRGYLNPFGVVAIAAAIVGVRFAYGLRMAGPGLIGMSPIWPRAGLEGTMTNRGEPSSC